jgi:hypothetical protein
MVRTDRRNPFERAQATTAMVSDQTAVELYYDYNTVPEEHRDALRRSALTIKPRLKRAAEDLFVIGRELMAVKARLPHGTYTDWLDIEFGLSDRMAQRFMSVSERLGPKSDKLSVLPPSTLYLLAAPSTPDEAIATVEQRLRNGERITVAFVQRAILAAKQKTQAQTTAPAVIDSEVVNSRLRHPEGADRKAAVHRLERTLATVIDLLSDATHKDWVALFQTDAVKHLRDEVSQLQQALLQLK